MRELAAVVERDRETLAPLRDRYDAIDVKLDKTGDLTEALASPRRRSGSGSA